MCLHLVYDNDHEDTVSVEWVSLSFILYIHVLIGTVYLLCHLFIVPSTHYVPGKHVQSSYSSETVGYGVVGAAPVVGAIDGAAVVVVFVLPTIGHQQHR